MSNESNYINNKYQDFFEKSLLDIDPDIHKTINASELNSIRVNIISEINKDKELRNHYLTNNYSPTIGIELSGKPDLFGSIREVTELCRKVKGIIPVINWPHLHARGNRWLNDRESFKRVFDYLQASLGLEKFYTHFSGVEFDIEGNERHYSPIKKGEIKLYK